MVGEWLRKAALVAAVRAQGQASHEDVIEVLLVEAIRSFDQGPTAYVAALDTAVPGLGTALSDDANWKLTQTVRAGRREESAVWWRTILILSWLRFLTGHRIGSKRQTLAGFLRGYPNDLIKRIWSPGEKVTSRAIQLLRQRALKAIVEGVCRAYSLEAVGACEFKGA